MTFWTKNASISTLPASGPVTATTGALSMNEAIFGASSGDGWYRVYMDGLVQKWAVIADASAYVYVPNDILALVHGLSYVAYGTNIAAAISPAASCSLNYMDGETSTPLTGVTYEAKAYVATGDAFTVTDGAVANLVLDPLKTAAATPENIFGVVFCKFGVTLPESTVISSASFAFTISQDAPLAVTL